jgi:putative transposase
VLPLLYLRGFSTICTGSPRAISALRSKGCRARTRPVCRRPTSPDLPPAGKEYTAFRRGGRAGREYVYVWVDGVHLNLRLADDRLCTLLMIGARPNGAKELLAVEDGYRESAETGRRCCAISSGAGWPRRH